MKKIFSILVVITIGSLLFGSVDRQINLQDLSHYVTHLVMQVGVIIICAKLSGSLFEKFGLPSVLGEIFCGIILGPYLLGSIALPGFAHGLFPKFLDSNIHITPELYGFATIASIILLFIAGLKTDLDLLIRYFSGGFIVGIGGVLISFFAGNYLAQFMFDINFWHPSSLFLGTMTTATSVGISARILSDKKKMHSAEGVSILSAAVIDDILAIILLAIVVGIVESEQHPNTSFILMIAFKTIGIWAIFTGAGLIFAHKISQFLKHFHSPFVFSIIALSIAFMIAGIFEKTGLAMIIGAYVAGLSLSKTDIAYVLLESLEPLELFFVPIFFTVMGMMVDITIFTQSSFLIFGLVYSLVAILAKVIGCGAFSYLAGFNTVGSARIGLGMAPRGEVILIMAGFGLAGDIIDEQIFSAAIMLVLVSTIVAPLFLDKVLKIDKQGTKVEKPSKQHQNSINYKIANSQTRRLILNYILETFQEEGFFVSRTKGENNLYQIRKDKLMIRLIESDAEQTINISIEQEQTIFAQTIVYEALVKINTILAELKHITKPKEIGNKLINFDEKQQNSKVEIKQLTELFRPDNIILELKAKNKIDSIRELLDLICSHHQKIKAEQVLDDILLREKALSTAIGNFVALPHAKTSGTESSHIAIGICPEGIDFESLDGKPTKIIILFISPNNAYKPHLKIVAELSKILGNKDNIDAILKAKSKEEVYRIFSR